MMRFFLFHVAANLHRESVRESISIWQFVASKLMLNIPIVILSTYIYEAVYEAGVFY